jgi:uncharacterized protein YecT (DUF1311 family)
MKPLAPFLAALAAIASAAAYAGATLSAAYTQCMEKAAASADMHACIGTEFAAQDRRLNEAYANLRASFDESADSARRAALTQAQRDWIRFRDSNCAFYRDSGGGTRAGVGAGMCRLRMSAERADELEALAREP